MKFINFILITVFETLLHLVGFTTEISNVCKEV